ncbi:MAG: hypothetical protein HGA47_12495 [Zoogloea sp.]|nr:hypothetical protein [Zoogloea sp.]
MATSKQAWLAAIRKAPEMISECQAVPRHGEQEVIFAIGASRMISAVKQWHAFCHDWIQGWHDWPSFIIFVIGIACMLVSALLLICKHLF